jgi:DNA-binding response OmpR family regulator
VHILVVEDDDRLARTVEAGLVAAGYVVEIECDGETAWFRGDTEAFDAIVLDLGLPTMDGLTVLKRWRNAGRSCPVLILTARGQWEERVEGIEAGADDYLVKPFRLEEVVARVRALIRRSKGQSTSRVSFSGLILDMQLMRLSRDGVPITLTRQEYRLLTYLALNRGRVVSKGELTDHIYSLGSDREANSIEVLVGRVRRRVGEKVIQTQRGFGYFIEGGAP